MTFERKALTSLALALCLLAPEGLSAAADTQKTETAEKATETPAKGKEEAPAPAKLKEAVAPANGTKEAKPAAPNGKAAPKPAVAEGSKPAAEPAKPAANGKDTKPAGEKAEMTKGETAKETAAPEEEPATEEEDEAMAERKEAEATAVARPVSSDPVQVYGWREWVLIGNLEMKMPAKLDTGALTSSIHAEEKELFERDGKKWVRFIVTDPGEKNSPRTRVEAPLVRIAHIKEPGGKSVAREVVRLNFTIGERKMRADFTLNNRSNMLSPVLIGRTTIKEIGLVDPSRAYLADQKIMR
ncbi:ATP-dependent zinc protease family protein [Luteolibacter luteus]|uniref:ATP-dependent zinc protease n=1 Tax=Luteolibacter luteus TaxID=2728835 RepID=A0A858RQ53_9BACT|nr:ATP-dependent zinc protease [Luteolibacter luteus]QJE98654.1 ATP-dependent zinc protease [Luteolibacter luteus]